MPGDPKECREHAQHCYRLAAEAHTPVAKKRFEDLASVWMGLATELEEARALVEAWGDPIKPMPSMSAAGSLREARS